MKFLSSFFIAVSIFFVNYVFANSQSNLSSMQQQDAQIEDLKNRVEVLENAVKTLTRNSNIKTPESNNELVSEQKHGGLSPKTEYDLALASLKSGKFEEAQNKFTDFMKKYPQDKLHENAMFWYAESLYRANDFDKAAINYSKAYKEYPKGIKSPDSLLKLALSLGELGKEKEACSVLVKLKSEFPNRPTNSISRARDAERKFNCKK